MEQRHIRAIVGTNEDTGDDELVVLAGGSDIGSLAQDVAQDVGKLMVQTTPASRSDRAIRVIWVLDGLNELDKHSRLEELQCDVCDEILRMDLPTSADVKVSFQVRD